jgi:hypothetical protein
VMACLTTNEAGKESRGAAEPNELIRPLRLTTVIRHSLLPELAAAVAARSKRVRSEVREEL